jgi:alcohol dehydrogenase class IV
MPFIVKVQFYKTIMFFLGLILKFVPLSKPMIYSGSGASLQLCNNIIHFGYKNVLIVTDAMLYKMGLLDAAIDRLKSNGVSVVVYDGVEPNPTFAQVDDGLNLARRNRCDAVLAFGGGSSIDAAKVISLAATSAKSPQALIGFLKSRQPGLPLYAVPTTAGTGSEVSIAAVISDPVTHQKGVIADPKSVPVAAALDPDLMLGLPGPITAATGMDALTHAIEAYLAAKMATDESDAYALAAARLIFENLREVYTNGGNVNAREAMAVASCYAALAFNRTGLGYVHGIAHQFGAHYNTPHGLANAIVLPYILDFQKDSCQTRLAALALATGQAVATEDPGIQASKFIAAVRQLGADLNIPATLDALETKDIPDIAQAALKESHYTYSIPKYMDQDQCEALISQMAS